MTDHSRDRSSSARSISSPRLRPFSRGEQLAARYRIERLLGRGGMGDVYEAFDEELSIPVAIKTLRSDVGRTREGLWRLKREVLLARAVWHPHVCRIYDLGRHDEGEEAVWFLTMELLEGETLQGRLSRQGRIAPGEALPLVEQMAAGLGAAHRAGVIHRDFKPGNVMLVPSPQGVLAVVTDFGLASPVAMKTAGDVESSGVVGTPDYLAPERVLGDEALPATDIYALGVVLYRMVTGTLPFAGPSAMESMLRRVVEDPIPPRTLVKELDERWEAVILRCLARAPADRFARAEDVAEALVGRAPVVGSGALRRGLRAQSSLPPERDAFIGREAELSEIGHRFSAGTRIVALLGAAGMGKTRLAVRFGWETFDQWPGGVWFCDLTEARDSDGIATAVAGSLGVPLGRGNVLEQLGHAIAGRGRCLVILDNFEQVATHAAESLGRWSDRASEASFLVTSRERLDLRGPWVVMVEPLRVERGAELFLERARWQRPGLQLDERDRASVDEVVTLADGMPLAIELAAARMRLMTVRELAKRMREGLRVLGGEGPGRHATLRAAIDGSWDLLRPWEQAAWAQCSIFEGGFTLEAAEAVLDLAPWVESPWVVDVLQSLVDKSLIRPWVPEEPVGAILPEARFGMYASLHQYAGERLRTAGAVPGSATGAKAEQAAAERHGNWYARLGTTEALESLYENGGQLRWWRLQPEMENLVAAFRRAVVRKDPGVATAAFRALGEIVELRGPYSLAVELGYELLAMPLGRVERASALGTLGVAERLNGNDESVAHLAEALALQREARNRVEEGKVLNSLGKVHHERGRIEQARHYYEAALELCRDAGIRRLEGTVLGNLAGLLHEQGRMVEANAGYHTALAIHREVGNRRLEGIVLGNLGALYSDRGRIQEALAHYEAAIAIHREVGDRRAEGVAVGNLGNLHLYQGRIDEALSHHRAALAIRREVGDRRSEGIILGNLGSTYLEQGRFDEAREQFEAALAILREVHDPRAEGAALGNLADIDSRQGRTQQARESIEHGEALLREVGDLLEIGKVLCVRAELEQRDGQASAAVVALKEAETLAERVGAEPDSELGRRLSRLHQSLGLVRP